MKVVLVFYIIFLFLSFVGREGLVFWNKVVGIYWEEGEEGGVIIWKNVFSSF